MMLGRDIVKDTWIVRNGSQYEELTADELAAKYGIYDPIGYCQKQYQEHAKPAGNVK